MLGKHRSCTNWGQSDAEQIKMYEHVQWRVEVGLMMRESQSLKLLRRGQETRGKAENNIDKSC